MTDAVDRPAAHVLSPGAPLLAWQPAASPARVLPDGRCCSLVAMTPHLHARILHDVLQQDEDHWRYLPYGPFADAETMAGSLSELIAQSDVTLYVIKARRSGQVLGFAGYRQCLPAQGLIELAHVNFSPLLRRSRIASEALFLLLDQVFRLGYRRCEWRCDLLNEPSRQAAMRLGFVFEGVLRQAMVVKGRNRDTALFSMLDGEWPRIRRAMTGYLSDDNFDAAGQQLRPLRYFLAV